MRNSIKKTVYHECDAQTNGKLKTDGIKVNKVTQFR